jgi:fibro-slime domain-containing protein
MSFGLSRAASMAARIFACVAVITSISCAHAAEEDDDKLIYRVTIRDFIPAICFGVSAELRAEWAAAWKYRISHRVPDTDNAANCPYKDQIIAGELLPNLDFQASNYQDGIPSNAGRNITFVDTDGNTIQTGQITPIADATLKVQDSGLSTPQYCSTSDLVRCGQATSGNARPASSGLKYFKSWYTDDRRTNRRIGARINLQDPDGDGTYEFNSGAFFNPIAEVPFADPADKNPDNALRWDKRQLVQDACTYPLCRVANNNPFFLTTEMHAFFEYRGGEKFVFSGDDDVWVFINDKLAIDMGGIHSEIKATFLLDDNKDRLGLELNKTYSLDLFHAERHTHESNFRLSTTLVSACNVLKSGNTSITLSALASSGAAAATGSVAWVTSAGASVDADRGVITLTDGLHRSVSEFVYHPVQQNIGAGFVLEFDFVFPDMRSADSDGFAFVMHSAPDGLDDLPTSSSGNLGFRFLRNSAVIALDMCPDRPNCATNAQQLSLYYTKADGSERTRHRSTEVPNPLNKNGTITTMRVVYYHNPSYLEVYLNDSLHLVDKAFDPVSILGGRDAYVGFTTGTSAAYSAAVNITRWEMKTVGVSVSRTSVLGSLAGGDARPVVTADGIDEAAFTIKTVDKCDIPVDGGGLKDWVSAVMVVVPQPSLNGTQRSLMDAGNGTAVSGNATYGDVRNPVKRTTDNLDGTYSVIFSTTTLAAHDLFIRFGDECADGDAFEAYETNLALASQGKACWTGSYADVVGTRSQPTASPTLAGFVPETFAPTPGPADETSLLVVGASAGAAVLLCLGCGVVTMCYRRKWVSDQAYVERGRLAKLNEGIDYDDGELQDLQRQYQDVQQQLLREKAMRHNPGKTADIDRIQVEMQSIADHMRYLKEKKQREATDHTSDNRFSMRMSWIMGPRQTRRQFGGDGRVTSNKKMAMSKRSTSSFRSSNGGSSKASASSLRNFVVPDDADMDPVSRRQMPSRELHLPRQSSSSSSSSSTHSLNDDNDDNTSLRSSSSSSSSSTTGEDNDGGARQPTTSVMLRSASILDTLLDDTWTRHGSSVSSDGGDDLPDILAPSAAYDARQAPAVSAAGTAASSANAESVPIPDVLVPTALQRDV